MLASLSANELPVCLASDMGEAVLDGTEGIGGAARVDGDWGTTGIGGA